MKLHFKFVTFSQKSERLVSIVIIYRQFLFLLFFRFFRIKYHLDVVLEIFTLSLFPSHEWKRSEIFNRLCYHFAPIDITFFGLGKNLRIATVVTATESILRANGDTHRQWGPTHAASIESRSHRTRRGKTIGLLVICVCDYELSLAYSTTTAATTTRCSSCTQSFRISNFARGAIFFIESDSVHILWVSCSLNVLFDGFVSLFFARSLENRYSSWTLFFSFISFHFVILSLFLFISFFAIVTNRQKKIKHTTRRRWK